MSNQVSGGASTNTAQSTSANTSATQASTASGSVSNTSLSSIQSCPQKKKANLKLHVKSKGTSLKPSSVIPEASIRIEGCGDYYGKALKDGTYSKKRIEAGKYKMKCYKPGYSTKKDVDIILSEGQDVDIEVILDECQRVQKHEVSFNSARTNSRVTVHVWERNAHCDLCNSNKTSFHFFSRMNIDIDGAPNCYGPAGILDVHGKPPLDNLGNAGDPPPLKDANNNIIHWPPGPPHYGKPKPNYNAPHNLWRWKGVAVDSHNLPLVQTNNDPFPNFYVSQGALANPNVPGEDNPKHWIDSRNVNYFSLPLSMTNMCNKGDLAAVIIPSADVNSEYYKFKIKTLVFAILADRGGEGIGEGSIALGKALGGRERQTIESPVIFVVFPNTNVMGRLNWPQANESIDEQSRVNAQMHAIGLQLIGLQHWNEWGGKDDQGVFKTDGPEERINYCLSELCTLSIASETELTLQPDILNPNDPDRMRTRTRIAVTEKVTLTAMGAQPPITWKVIKGQSKLNVLRGPVVYLTAHDISEETIVEVTDSSGCKDKLQFTVDCCFLITPAKLKSIYGNAMDDAYALSLANHFNAYYDKFKIDTCLRQAHFFAQAYQEAKSGKPVVEDIDNIGSLMTRWPTRFTNDQNKVGKRNSPDLPENNESNPSLVLDADYIHDAHKLFNHVYAKRMGNSDEISEDGYNYRGRGYLKITGKTAYTEVQKEIKKALGDPSAIDILVNFESVKENPAGIVSAMAYWNWKQMSAKADTGDTDIVVDSIARLINPDSFATTASAADVTNRTERKNNFHKTKDIFKTDKCSNK